MASELYERIRAACCVCHGFETDAELEQHARAITLHILRLRGLVP
jgi:hypothetical protein